MASADNDVYQDKRVYLRGDHPWAGEAGTVIGWQTAHECLVVRLDNGVEVFAWPRQYRVMS